MKALADKVAVVTGAASGIGRSLAVNLGAKGCHLAISDVNQEGLQETVRSVSNPNVKITTHIVDVADRDQVYRYAEEVVNQHDKANIVINNAGVALGDSIEDVSYEDFEWIMNINFWGVVYGTKAFLPHLKRESEAHIVNISSINGILTNPYNAPYCATKFAVRGFTETLRQELHGTSIGVTVVHPGGIKTDIVRNARFRKHANPNMAQEDLVAAYDEKVFKTTADDAARRIIFGIENNKQRVLIGGDAKFLDWLTRLFPVSATEYLRRMTYKYTEQKKT
jgi:NADP-dependent 3-hydroxy acid dehydrogenase YdfG